MQQITDKIKIERTELEAFTHCFKLPITITDIEEAIEPGYLKISYKVDGSPTDLIYAGMQFKRLIDKNNEKETRI
jgi:hypothetical protein